MTGKGKRTQAVHAGIRRSQYGEVSEAIYLTQGFVYDTAEQAEARFEALGEDEFIYARYGNPTVRMLRNGSRRSKGPRTPLPPPPAWRRSTVRWCRC